LYFTVSLLYGGSVAGPFDNLRVGETDRGGDKISFIIGWNDQVMVYMVEGDHLKIHAASDRPTEREIEILRVFDRLYALISLTLRKGKTLSLKHDLAGALYHALSDRDATCPVSEYFTDVSEHIHTRALDAARFVYVVSGFATAFTGSLLLCLLYLSLWTQGATIPALLLGAIGGAVGSAVSIFARSNSVEISPFKEHVFTAFQGASRIALGALFGFVFVCCVKANILLGVLSDKTAGLFAFSILAGFSETFVPELLKRMETEIAKSPSDKPGRNILFKRGGNR
jgi:hypothetical protein